MKSGAKGAFEGVILKNTFLRAKTSHTMNHYINFNCQLIQITLGNHNSIIEPLESSHKPESISQLTIAWWQAFLHNVSPNITLENRQPHPGLWWGHKACAPLTTSRPWQQVTIVCEKRLYHLPIVSALTIQDDINRAHQEVRALRNWQQQQASKTEAQRLQ
jgi:hypothetical protein